MKSSARHCSASFRRRFTRESSRILAIQQKDAPVGYDEA